MTPAAKKLIERSASWPEEDLAELEATAREIEARRVGGYVLSDEERAGVEKGLHAMRENRFASEERIEAIFRKARSTDG